MCRAAWSLFQEIEKAGGAAAALECGLIQKQGRRDPRAREKAIATRRDPLTGTSEFPHLREKPVKVLRSRRRECRSGHRLKITLLPPHPARRTVREAARRFRRDAERDRRAAEGLSRHARHSRPTSPRARPSPRISSRPAASRRWRFRRRRSRRRRSRPPARSSPACARPTRSMPRGGRSREGARRGGARHIYLAGRPGELEAALRAAGVQTFIFAGCDVLAMLQAAHAYFWNAVMRAQMCMP